MSTSPSAFHHNNNGYISGVLLCILINYHIPYVYGGSNYTYYSSQNGFYCDKATVDDICTLIHDDLLNNAELDFDCGNAGICVMKCEESTLLTLSVINGRNSSNFIIESCGLFTETDIYLPNNGNATLSFNSPLTQINIEEGYNTQNIIINLSDNEQSGIMNNCLEIDIKATNSKFLQLDLSNTYF